MKKEKLIISMVVFALGSFLLGGCGSNPPVVDDVAVQTKQNEIVELKDGDTYDLVAGYVDREIKGKNYKMLAYNGSIPGPTLKIPEGGDITIRFKNNTDIASSIHSHGVRLANEFDGVVDDMHPAVQPGDTFVYKIKFPDPGMFWYHPHLYESFTQSRGLYGNYWVVPKEVDYWSPADEEVPLIFNDLLVENGELDSFRGNLSPYTLMGKFGNIMLLNGDADYKKTFQEGEVVRFYITNAANTRVLNLSIPNVKMKLVGGDNGKYELEQWKDSIVLSPSERVIVEVMFDKAGTFLLKNINPQKTYTLGTFIVSDEKSGSGFAKEFSNLKQNKAVVSDINVFRKVFEKQVDKSITFTLEMMGMGSMGGHGMSGGSMMDHGTINDEREMMKSDDEKIEWEDSMPMMNAMSNTDTVEWKIVDDVTKDEGMDIDWKFKMGDKVKIKIFNDPDSEHPMQHPFHIHGQRFLVLSENGVKNTNFVWKDTVLVPKGDTVEILVDMQNPGMWMAHCHIAEHLEAGMMMEFEVE